MHDHMPIHVREIIACPNCLGDLEQDSNRGYACPQCHEKYLWTESRSLDLRLKANKKVHLDFEVGTPSPVLRVLPLSLNPNQQVDFTGTTVPYHLTRELMSYFPRAAARDSLMLDLGCGNGIHREVCQHAGFKYVGLDYHDPKAPLLGDAHALPFKDSSFQFILSIAVLEHIRFPFVMMREVFRALKPGGVFIGTVAFLEPFHGNSFYHHSHLGILNCLQYGGFQIEHISPSARWSVFRAQAGMSAKMLFPKIPTWLSRQIILLPHRAWRLWWFVIRFLKPELKEPRGIEHITGAFAFIAKKRTS